MGSMSLKSLVVNIVYDVVIGFIIFVKPPSLYDI